MRVSCISYMWPGSLCEPDSIHASMRMLLLKLVGSSTSSDIKVSCRWKKAHPEQGLHPIEG